MEGPVQAEGGGRNAQRFIDPKVLSRISNLDLVARITIDGFISGLHRTRFLGVSTEFAEHRGYSAGDDVRHIDWRVYGRTDRLYVKTYEAETNADMTLVLDASGSMNYASGETHPSKFDYARFVAASLCHLGHRQRDRVGLAVFNESIQQWIPPSGRHRDRVMICLDGASAEGGSDLVESLERLGERLNRRGIVVVISDFYCDPAQAATALETLRARGHDVIALHILDPVEQDLSKLQASGDAETLVLEDLESGQRMPVDRDRQLAEFNRLMTEHVESLRGRLGGQGIHYDLFSSAQPLDYLLFRFLNARMSLARVR